MDAQTLPAAHVTHNRMPPPTAWSPPKKIGHYRPLARRTPSSIHSSSSEHPRSTLAFEFIPAPISSIIPIVGQSNLPRLLYLGDVPIESITAGGAQMYKLLKEYPPSLLRIAQGRDLHGYHPANRLPNVQYDEMNFGWPRLFITRFAHQYARYLLWWAPHWRRQVRPILRDFRPEAILTVAHRFSWIVADLIAQEFNLPLHLVIHDDPLRMAVLDEAQRDHFEKQFAPVYRRAASRLCVSPYMAELYERKFAAPGTVFYPARDADIPTFATPSPRNATQGQPLNFAFAGSLNYAGYPDMLARFSAALEATGHRLLLFGGHSLQTAQKFNLDRPHVTRFPMMPMDQLIHTLRDQADAMLVPMTFRDDLKFDMQISFPSKLTDYTAIGVPILIWGPAYCSGIRWAQDNPGAAEVVVVDEDAAVTTAIKKLAAEPELRERLATRAMNVGHAQFSRASITKQFFSVLTDGK
jgi:glycosyltransferase involved in cell wall biosynthesis